jgi:hypothetical protein
VVNDDRPATNIEVFSEDDCPGCWGQNLGSSIGTEVQSFVVALIRSAIV